MNKVIKGRIAGGIEVAQTNNGKMVVNFRIAENKAFFNRKTKRKQRITNFYSVKGWNGVAEAIEKQLDKGDLVEFHVNVRPNSWLTREGELKDELILTVNRFSLVRKSRRIEEGN